MAQNNKETERSTTRDRDRHKQMENFHFESFTSYPKGKCSLYDEELRHLFNISILLRLIVPSPRRFRVPTRKTNVGVSVRL